MSLKKTTQSDIPFDFEHTSREIVDSLPMGLITFDTDLNVIHANKKAIECLGKDNVYGRGLDEILSEGTDSEIWDNWEKILKDSITTGKSQRIEKVNFSCQSGNKLFIIYCQSLQNAQGQTIGGTIAVEDITEKINIERKMESIERFAAVGKLAGKVAHELNNPMDGILRYINLTTRIVQQEEMHKPIEYLSKCREGLMRMVQIISELLEFSRSTYNAFDDMYLRDIIDDAIKSMEHKISVSKIKIVKDYSDELQKIRGGNLFQVFCNLIKNSADAMAGEGTLTIRTYKYDPDKAAIEFSDTGPGIAAENLKDVFEPFFTTKKHGKGTGLGLAICKDIIEKYNGNITVKNNKNGGCCFLIILPLNDKNEVSGISK